MGLKEWKAAIKGFFGRGLFPHQLSFLLGSALRRFVLSPEELADRLHLSQAARVLELGPGPGYFSVEIAHRLPRGRLELFDLQREMLKQARRRLERAGMSNVGFTRGDAVHLPFSEKQFDVVFLVAVLGEVADSAACVQDIYRTLRPGGLLSITEQPGDPDFLPLSTIRALAERAGFEFVERFGHGKNYTANFRKPSTDRVSF
jgi:ubiquinone/menaquinone biosynthesis C-methylase UbiE